jgi:ubiquitin C-terminal hydrolase
VNRKLIKNKRITRKKKTKTKQFGGFKQNGGKINFCYDSGDSGGIGGFEIVYLYPTTDTEIIFKTKVFEELKNLFGKDKVKEEQNLTFTDEYIKYFFRLPNQDKKNMLDTGLEDTDPNNFNGTNFSGLHTTLDIEYYNKQTSIRMNKYIITDNKDKINNILNTLKHKFMTQNTEKIENIKLFLVINYENIGKISQIDILIKQPKQILGIVKKHNLVYEPNRNIELYTNINCNNIKIENLALNRYINIAYGYQNHGNTCYANALIQLLKNVTNINTQLKQTQLTTNINDNIIFKDKKKIYKLLYDYMFPNTTTKTTTNKTENTFYDAEPYLHLLNIFIWDKTQQKDSHELFKKLNLYSVLDEFKNIFVRFSYDNNKKFIKYDIDSTDDKNFEVILQIQHNSNYDSMQEILYNYHKGYLITMKFTNNETNIITYRKGINQECIYVDTHNNYIFIQLSQFIYDNPLEFTGKKKQFHIKNLESNICIKNIPDKVLKKMKPKTLIEIIDDDFKENTTYSEYELISIVQHQGSGTGAGHYVNYSKQINENKKVVWVCYNDRFLIKNIDNITNEIFKYNNTPYLFLYKRLPPSTASA